MELIGFIKQHNSYISEAKELLISKSELEPFANQIISYLNSGTILLDYMKIVSDEDGNEIGTLSIVTDGTWIWPSYFSYYLNRYPRSDQFISFVNFIKEKGFKMDLIDAEQKNKLTDFYLLKAGALRKYDGPPRRLDRVKPKIKKNN